jgi:Bacterial Ig domain/Protein of unknown function (DUF1565)/Fibronectin type III domain
MLHRRPVRRRARILIGLGLAVVVLTGITGLWAAANAAGTAYFVNPTGSDTNAGTSAAAPFKTIQKALNLAAPGTTITLAAGVYQESIVTKTAGTASSPITIKGPGDRTQAVVKNNKGYVVSVNHSYYTLDGFTVDGQPAITDYPSSLSAVRAFKDDMMKQGKAVNTKLVYVGADTASRDITGTRISNMVLNGSGGECVRFRNRATASLVVGSLIQWCGMYGQGDDSSNYKYHNAEGVYIGTSPKSTDQPLYANDTSNNIVVRDSTIKTFGSECFEVKENANNNRIEDSDCGYNDEPLSFKGSNIELRGDHNLIRRTKIHDSRSWNVKLASDSAQYDKGGNSVEANTFASAAAPALRADQSITGSTFCGNTFSSTPISEGSAKIGDPRQSCAVDTQRPTASITAPADKATVSGTVPITVDAADNVGVTRVDFEVDGALVGSDNAAPWSQNWTVPSAPGPHKITVTAHDAADNVATVAIDVNGGVDAGAPTAPGGVTAQGLSATSAKVSWTAATDDVGVTGYRVMRDGTQVGTTTTELTYTDSTLTAGRTYTYTVTAVDAAGNVSPASNSATVTTPTAQTIAFEAESGTVSSPMTVASDAAAQGGKYVVQNSGSGTGKVTYSVAAPVAGSYLLAFRVIAPSTSSDALNYAVDGRTAQVQNLPSSARTAWTWVNGPTLNLSAGRHTLVVSKRENGVRLDALTLTPPGAAAATTPEPTTTPTPTTTPAPTTGPTVPPTSASVTTSPATTTTTAPPTSTAPAVPVGTSAFEAESGTVTAGMTVATDAKASGGQYVVARSSGGTVTYTVSVPTRGTYMIAGWVKAPNSSSDAFTVRLDTGSAATWNLTRSTTAWTYDGSDNPTFSLSAGTHKITLSYREANAAVDRLVLVRR